jgi:hypothetical protein
MAVPHSQLRVLGVFRTSETVPDLPELRQVAVINQNTGRYHPDVQGELRVRLDLADVDWLFRILETHRVRVVVYFLSASFERAFWDNLPNDCVGSLLAADGGVRLRDARDYNRVIPLAEPLYTCGRPEGDAEPRRNRPHVLFGGGIPIVSDELLATLRRLGAKGEVAQITYRGHSKKAYDTVQEGFKRFLVQPTFDMPYEGAFDFLPQGVAEQFGICTMFRTQGERAWYEITLDRDKTDELRRLRRTVLLAPVFARDGVTHQWVTRIDAAVQRLKP